MKQSSWLVLIIIVLVLAGGYVWWHGTQSPMTGTTPVTTATSTQIVAGVDNATYTNSALGFTIQYPSTAAASETDFNGYVQTTQTPVTSFVLPASMSAGTNLGTAGVYVGATSSASIVASCTSASTSTGETAQGTQTIGTQQFAVFSSSDAGAGNFYETKSYRTVANGSCLEINETLHSGNIDNYPVGAVTEFNHDEFSGILEAIVHTYQAI